MTLLYWLLIIGSAILIGLIFFKKYRIVRSDLAVQKEAEENDRELPDPEEMLASDFNSLQEEEEDEKVLQKSPRKLFAEADTHYARGEHGEAEMKFKVVIEMDPRHIDAHSKLGMLLMKQGRFGDAELYFGKLVTLVKDPVHFSNLGAALYQQQRLKEAAAAYENAIALDDKRAARLQSLAQVYHELGEDELALKYFALAASRKPKDTAIRWILVDYYERLEMWAKALETLEKIAELDPYNEDVKGRIQGLNEE